MKTFYKLTNWLWGTSDLPWPIFGIVFIGTFLKIIVKTIWLCLVVVVFPFMYLYGLYKWVSTKKMPEGFYPFWTSALFGWYVFVIVYHLV